MAGLGQRVASVVSGSREATVRALKGAARDWAGVPSGPLGQVAARWVMPRLHSALYRVMGAAARLREEDVLLEVACGSGVFLAEQAEHVGRVAGLDLSDVQVDIARRRLAARIAAGTAEIVHGDAAALPWPDGTFTVVTCVGSFETFPDPEKVLGEMVRVLRPGGRVVLNIGERVPVGTQTHRMWGEYWVWAEDDVRRMIQNVGLVDVTIDYASSAAEGRARGLVDRWTGALGQRIVHGIKPVQPAAEVPTGEVGEPTRR